MNRLEGKRAIVTGAGSGIGEATAKRFAREGAKVVIAERNPASGEAVAREINDRHPGSALFVPTDVADPVSVAAMVRETVSSLGAPNVLVNNAGIIVFGEPLATTEDDWRRCMAVDLDGAWHCAKAVLPHMLEAREGAIINIASNHAERVIRGTFPYPVAKHGVIGLTRALALEYADKGIAVNAISPGYILTPMAESHFASQPDPAAYRAEQEAAQPLKRLGRPEEIAAVAAMLASDEARFMTGSNLVIDGAITIRMYD
jgi:NAD(P)-dependent dehydrogenase (short-subunit alcohol dehydrogenase family)